MKKKLIISMLVILVAIVATVGGTMAWFTDQAVIEPNVFQAGTVRLNGIDSWDENAELIENNWNPGDCSPKFMAVEYFGTKRAFVRMELNAGWQGEPVLSDKNVQWKVYIGDETYEGLYDLNGDWIYDWDEAGYDSLSDWFNDGEEWVSYNIDEDWEYFEGWYYYNGDDEDTILVLSVDPDIKVQAVSGRSIDAPLLIALMQTVCLNGDDTGNQYQGRTYTISARFQAIQASHAGEWSWDDVVPYGN